MRTWQRLARLRGDMQVARSVSAVPELCSRCLWHRGSGVQCLWLYVLEACGCADREDRRGGAWAGCGTLQVCGLRAAAPPAPCRRSLLGGLLCEYMWAKSVENVPKKRVASLWQPHSRRALPGRTARAFGALPGSQGVLRTDQTD